MTLLEYFRFQFPTFGDDVDADVNQALEIAKDHRLSGKKQRGDMSQCLYAAYLLSLRKRDIAESSHVEQYGVGATSNRLGDEARQFVSGSSRSEDLLDPAGYLARYRDMQKEGGVFLAAVGRNRGCGYGW